MFTKMSSQDPGSDWTRDVPDPDPLKIFTDPNTAALRNINVFDK